MSNLVLAMSLVACFCRDSGARRHWDRLTDCGQITKGHGCCKSKHKKNGAFGKPKSKRTRECRRKYGWR